MNFSDQKCDVTHQHLFWTSSDLVRFVPEDQDCPMNMRCRSVDHRLGDLKCAMVDAYHQKVIEGFHFFSRSYLSSVAKLRGAVGLISLNIFELKEAYYRSRYPLETNHTPSSNGEFPI